MIWLLTDDEWRPVADRIHRRLLDRGAHIEVFAPDRSARIAVKIRGSALEVYDGDERLALPEVAVVLRHPIPPAGEQTALDRDGRQFVRRQWHTMFDGLTKALDYRGVRIVNPPAASLSDEKTYQMLAAADAGLKTLATIHTSSGEAIERHHGGNPGLAMKSFNPIVRRETQRGRQTMSRTVALPAVQIASGLDRSRVKSPSIVQPFVSSPFEHRVVVVGEQVHGARIHKVGAAKVDVRSVPAAELETTPSQLPTEVAQACVRLVQSVGGEIAAIDLIEADGEFIFLDLNCSGHFLYVEQLTGAPICSDIADLAIKRLSST